MSRTTFDNSGFSRCLFSVVVFSVLVFSVLGVSGCRGLGPWRQAFSAADSVRLNRLGTRTSLRESDFEENQFRFARSIKGQEPDPMQHAVPAQYRTSGIYDQVFSAAGQDEELLPVEGEQAEEMEFPIDLANALAMAGANHLDIEFAREKVVQASSQLTAAESLKLPSLRFGVNWARHAGRIQGTAGNLIDADRNSLFIGAGAGLGDAPLLGGAGGPPRMFVNMSLADTIFAPLIAQREVAASHEGVGIAENDSLLNVAMTYLELSRAASRVANVQQSRSDIENLVKLTRDYADAGAGSEADVDRAKTELARMDQVVVEAQRILVNQSNQLKFLIRLEVKQQLIPSGDFLVPLEIVEQTDSVGELIEEALASRQELKSQFAITEAAQQRFQRDAWQPFLPNLQMGFSGGFFGGGASGTFANSGDRSDFEAIAIWELRNLGMGTYASKQVTASRVRQNENRLALLKDKVKMEVANAKSSVDHYRQQLKMAESRLKWANESLEKNQFRVKSGEGLPIELQQAIGARADALQAYTDSVLNYNRAQFVLVRAVGKLPSLEKAFATLE